MAIQHALVAQPQAEKRAVLFTELRRKWHNCGVVVCVETVNSTRVCPQWFIVVQTAFGGTVWNEFVLVDYNHTTGAWSTRTFPQRQRDEDLPYPVQESVVGDWARWKTPKQPKRGKKWHAVRDILPGRNGFTYCGHVVPTGAETHVGAVTHTEICTSCARVLNAKKKKDVLYA